MNTRYLDFKLSNLTFLQKVQKEPIPEEQELDFLPSVEAEEHSDSNDSISEEAKEVSGLTRVETHEESRKGSFEDRQSIVDFLYMFLLIME